MKNPSLLGKAVGVVMLLALLASCAPAPTPAQVGLLPEAGEMAADKLSKVNI